MPPPDGGPPVLSVVRTDRPRLGGEHGRPASGGESRGDAWAWSVCTPPLFAVREFGQEQTLLQTTQNGGYPRVVPARGYDAPLKSV